MQGCLGRVTRWSVAEVSGRNPVEVWWQSRNAEPKLFAIWLKTSHLVRTQSGPVPDRVRLALQKGPFGRACRGAHFLFERTSRSRRAPCPCRPLKGRRDGTRFRVLGRGGPTLPNAAQRCPTLPFVARTIARTRLPPGPRPDSPGHFHDRAKNKLVAPGLACPPTRPDGLLPYRKGPGVRPTWSGRRIHAPASRRAKAFSSRLLMVT
jgi:hypothetical protein